MTTRIYEEAVDIPMHKGYKLGADNAIYGKLGKPLAVSGHPYGFVNVYINGKSAILYVHRAIALVHVPGYFEGAWIDHKDDNPLNNSPENLQWVSPKENSSHVKKKQMPERDFLKREIRDTEKAITRLSTKLHTLNQRLLQTKTLECA